MPDEHFLIQYYKILAVQCNVGTCQYSVKRSRSIALAQEICTRQSLVVTRFENIGELISFFPP
jgi:hypothetical protein